MNKTIFVVKHRFLQAVVAILAAVSTNAVSAQEEAPDDGAYLFAAAGCQGCHTDVVHKGALLAGGRALTTPFRTFSDRKSTRLNSRHYCAALMSSSHCIKHL